MTARARRVAARACAALLVAAVATLAPVPPASGLAPAEPDPAPAEAPAGIAGTAPAPPEVTASGAVLWDPAAAAVLVDQDDDVPRPMASTTKIMTALLALEAGVVDDEVTVGPDAETAGALPGVARVGLTAGDVVPMRSLLAGIMLESGNDAAVAIADHVAGSEEAFVTAMNDRARELGLDDTGFVDASGLSDDPAHRASPRDLARLAEVAMRDPRFAELAGSASLDPEGIPPVDNRNELLDGFDGATGVKTGYTRAAGLCLVASAERDGRELYAVVLDSDDHHADAAALLEHGFDAWEHARLAGRVGTFRTSGGAVPVEVTEPAVAAVAAGHTGDVATVLAPSLEPGVPAGAGAGEAVLTVGGEEAARAPVVTARALPERPAGDASALGEHVQDALRDLARAGLAGGLEDRDGGEAAPGAAREVRPSEMHAATD